MNPIVSSGCKKIYSKHTNSSCVSSKETLTSANLKHKALKQYNKIRLTFKSQLASYLALSQPPLSLNLVSQLTNNYSLDMQTHYLRSLATAWPQHYGSTYFFLSFEIFMYFMYISALSACMPAQQKGHQIS